MFTLSEIFQPKKDMFFYGCIIQLDGNIIHLYNLFYAHFHQIHLGPLKTSPLECKIKFCGFDQCLAAWPYFVMTGPLAGHSVLSALLKKVTFLDHLSHFGNIPLCVMLKQGKSMLAALWGCA